MMSMKESNRINDDVQDLLELSIFTINRHASTAGVFDTRSASYRCMYVCVLKQRS